MMVLLPAFLWLLANSTLNRHSHLTSLGTIITHAHPFHKNKSAPAPFQGHHHSKKDLWLLDLFSTILLSLICAGSIEPIFRKLPPKTKINADHEVPVKEYFQVHHYHAPPGRF
jgi:tellurite resistance-related uncharacterized protein